MIPVRRAGPGRGAARLVLVLVAKMLRWSQQHTLTSLL